MGPAMQSPIAYTLALVSVIRWPFTGMRPARSSVTPRFSMPRLAVLGMRPVEMSTFSDTCVVFSFVSLFSHVSSTPPATFFTSTTLLFRSKVRPCFFKIFWNSVDTCVSAGPMILFKNSTTCTLAPRRDHTLPSSSPITPPPTTVSDCGTAPNSSAPVEETMSFSSMSSLGNPGSPATSLPTATTMLSASMSSLEPSALVTSIRFGPLKKPAPAMFSTLFALKRPAIPRVSPVMDFCFCFISAGTSTSRVPFSLMPCFLKECVASWYMWEACNRAFDGMHPTFRQVPPSAPRFSTQAVESPSCAALIAHTYPPGPPPTTTTSNFFAKRAADRLNILPDPKSRET
mmetsp:Transcript_15207/g.37809  ORF Transcript_15207/g.37809 Transcript_15207/m.37809 type:complete len:344 (-) Transcript_15207:426-1457(-)